MNRIKYAVLLVIFTGSLFAVFAHSTASLTDRSGDEAAIRKIDAAWTHAAETKDLEGVLAPYAADGSLLPFNAPMATGTVAIRQVWSTLMANPGFHLTFAPTKISIAQSGDMAWEVGTFELKLNDGQGAPLTMLGKYIVTWKKDGGAWKVAADIFNTDK